jgi:RNA polymerase sigma factor (sigma-70 family)
MAQNSIAGTQNVFEQVIAIKANDEKILGELYQHNYPKVESYILKNSGTADHAKDVFQEAFLALWRNIQLGKFQPENETAVDGFLYQVSKNKWLDYLRSGHSTKVVRMNDSLPEPYVLPADEDNEHIHIIKKHFKTLGENCRKVLTLFYYDNEPLKGIALAMGWTEETARNNKYRCLEKLREAVNRK